MSEGKRKEGVIIIESGKCIWSKCIFCPFAVKEIKNKPLSALKKRFDEKLEKTGDVKTLKLFSSGNFLDDRQIPAEFREYVIKRCIQKGIKELVIECLPSLITEKKLEELKKIANGKIKITFAIGLEIADDKILEKIKKPFRLRDYERATNILKKHGFDVRTYLMANLPFVKDIKRALKTSLDYALKYSDSVAIINTYARPGTELFRMWMDGKWKPLDREEFNKLVKGFVDGERVQAYYDDYVCPPKIPREEREFLKGVGYDYLVHKHFEVWHDYIARIYEVPRIKKYALFLPCSYKKPYSLSKTHRAVISRLMTLRAYPYIHQIMISNAGVIPREFEDEYPFNSYDWEEWKETEEIKNEYYEVTKKRLINYLRHKKKNYEKIFSYLKPDSLSHQALMDAARELNLGVIDCVDRARYTLLKKQGSKDILTDRELLDRMIEIIKRETDEE